MVTLLQIRDAVALHGIVTTDQLNRQFNASPALIQAMLDQLEALQKIARIEENPCQTGGCQNCPEGNKCSSVSYRFIS